MKLAEPQVARTAIAAAIRRATKAAQASVDKLDAAAIEDLTRIYKAAAADVAARIEAHAGPDHNVALQELQSVLAQVTARLRGLAQARDELLGENLARAADAGVKPFTAAAGGAVETTIGSGAAIQIANEALATVRTFVAADGLQLSDRLWRLDRHARDVVVNAIEQSVIQGHGAAQAAGELVARGMAVPADIAAKVGTANAGTIGKTAGDALFKGPGSPLDNALRLARTEINRAHGLAYIQSARAHPDCAGFRYLLSPQHPRPDICDLLSTQNVHGLGPGVYPPERITDVWPAHPNTLSYLEVVFRDQVSEADKAGQETTMQALAKLSPERQRGVLGAAKHEVFKAGKLSKGMVRTPWRAVQERIGKTAAAALDKEVQAAQKAVAEAAGKAALERAIARAQEKAAQFKIDQIAAASKGFAAKAFSQLTKAGLLTSDLAPSAALSKIESLAAELKAKKAQSDALSKYKSSLIAGKAPSASAQAAFAALPEADQVALAKKIEDIKNAAAAKAAQVAKPEDVLRFEDLERIGPQRGSNPGALYRHRITNEQWYVKTPASEDAARNEVLAAALYRAAGVDVPELRLLDVKGQAGVGSKIVENLRRDPAALRAGTVAGAREAFAVDAWLANWDVVGANFDNLLLQGTRAIRVDTGGALRYRAQGGLKGSIWGPRVEELDTLRNAQTNPQSASVFGGVTQAELVAGAQRIRAVSEDEIRRIVRQIGPINPAENEALVTTLLERRRDILRRLLPDDLVAPAPLDAAARVSDAEIRTIQAARINGYALRTDKGSIEDQQVLVWFERAKGGEPRTVAQLKVMGEGAASLDRFARAAGAGDAFPDGGVRDALVTAIKGIASQAAKSEALRAKDLERVQDAVLAFRSASRQIADRDVRRAFESHFAPWIEAAEQAVAAGVGKQAAWKSPGGLLEAFVPPVRTDPDVAVRFAKRDGVFERKIVERGNARATDDESYRVGYFLEAKIGDATVRYWPSRAEIPFALRNQVEISVPGGSAASAGRVFEALDRLGVDNVRSGPLDKEELYLRQIAYHRRDGYREFAAKAAEIDDQEARVAAMRSWLSEKIGRDVASLPGFRPDGVHQAFGHGRLQTFRPDLDGKEWERFQKDHVLFHGLTQQSDVVQALQNVLENGGQMAPTTDKLRRGIPVGGMSPDADLQTGGASYFFTRIYKRERAVAQEGIAWKSKLLARLDAISYDHDAFGRTSGDHVLANRKSTVQEWREASRRGSNETIFKNSLSLFDEIERINLRPAYYDRAIQMFQRAGYTTWPDGRPLTDVVKKVGTD